MNVVIDITPDMKRLARADQPLRTHEATNLKHKQNNRELSIHAPIQTNSSFQQAAKTSQKTTIAESKDLSKSQNSSFILKQKRKAIALPKKLSESSMDYCTWITVWLL